MVVGCTVQLHQDLGPGLLGTVYEVTLARKIEKRGSIDERRNQTNDPRTAPIASPCPREKIVIAFSVDFIWVATTHHPDEH